MQQSSRAHTRDAFISNNFFHTSANVGWIPSPLLPLADLVPPQLDGGAAGLLAQKVEDHRRRATERQGGAADVLGDEGTDEAPYPEDPEEGLSWWVLLSA
jgi:hypothetical protein